ncbi:MAG: response regulator [Chloroflexota bacterium]|nr:response regulator [Chloroflexota bacterium]MDQ5867997.1 response regulator [Chloroflexota bacterium]
MSRRFYATGEYGVAGPATTQSHYILRPGRGGRGMQPPDMRPDRSLGDALNEPKDVLVVEDEAYLCDLVADVLEAEGHTARTASNGMEALERVMERKPQLILLDLMMPVMDGWEFIRALRTNREWTNIPIVVVTAVYDIKRTQQETGAVAVVTKPFDIDQIAEVVNRFSSPST